MKPTRALEVFYQTGKPISLLQKEETKPPLNLDFIMFCLDVERTTLYKWIDEKVGMWEKYEFLFAWGGDSEREKKSIYSSLFDNLLLGVVITSGSKIIYINQSASSLSNVRGKKLGRDFYEIFGVKFEHFPSRIKRDGFIFDAGYIKENGDIKGIIYIITKEAG